MLLKQVMMLVTRLHLNLAQMANKSSANCRPRPLPLLAMASLLLWTPCVLGKLVLTASVNEGGDPGLRDDEFKHLQSNIQCEVGPSPQGAPEPAGDHHGEADGAGRGWTP